MLKRLGLKIITLFSHLFNLPIFVMVSPHADAVADVDADAHQRYIFCLPST